jgi:hypothetical protein
VSGLEVHRRPLQAEQVTASEASVEGNDEGRLVGAASIVSFASEPVLVAHDDEEDAPPKMFP